MTEECSNCRFSWLTIGELVKCRRYAPGSRDGLENGQRAGFPELFQYSWCGEWEPRK
jgi:hypothetical protein